jgi:hypothetical protein
LTYEAFLQSLAYPPLPPEELELGLRERLQHAASPTFQPYSLVEPVVEALWDLLEAGQLAQALDGTHDALATFPVDLPVLYAGVVIFGRSGHAAECSRLLARARRVLQSILHSGTGESLSDAVEVLTVREEYALLAFMDCRLVEQAMDVEDGQILDILSVEHPRRGTFDLHFKLLVHRWGATDESALAALASTFVYLAPGLDLQPLLRFSDQFERYLYVGLGLDAPELQPGIERQLRGYGNRLELAAVGPVRSAEDLGWSAEAGQFRSCPAWMQPQEWRDYLKAFRFARDSPVWGRELRFVRRVAGQERHLTVMYLAAEALFAYDTLTRGGEEAPAVVCTIQSGELERPGGLFERALGHHAATPLLWIRGFRPEYGCWRGADHPALLPQGAYAHPVQVYGGWFGWPERELGDWDGKRHVACFAREKQPFGHLPEDLELTQENHSLRLRRTPLQAGDLGSFDLVLARRSLLESLAPSTGSAALQAWEEAPGYLQRNRRPFSLRDALKHLSALTARLGARRVLMLPEGHEDEADELVVWLGTAVPKPAYLEIRFRDELDFLVLRRGQIAPEETNER